MDTAELFKAVTVALACHFEHSLDHFCTKSLMVCRRNLWVANSYSSGDQ